MLFNSEEKNMLLGAFTTGIVDMALEAYYAYKDGGGYNIRAHPEDPAYYLYFTPNEWIPPVDDLIALLGIPFLLWGVGKYKHSSKMRMMGIGGMVYGFSELIGWTALKLARYSAGAPVYTLMAGGKYR